MCISGRNRETRDVAKDIEYASAIRGIDIHKLWAWVRTVKDRDLGNKISDLTARLLGLASNKHGPRSLGRREKRRGSSRIPARRSARLAERTCLPSPMYHGTMFHVTVRFRGTFASAFSSKKFFAVSSGLLREMKPESTALGPGASGKYRISASIPPSHGSKLGMLKSGPT